jgi:pimeloyl-ACP methyl ester carboxylesterase
MDLHNLTTKDGIKIAGILWDRQAPKAVLLLHMMPATKESWTDLGSLLSDNGFNVLAIDFRGHGESGGGDYKTFSSEDHQKYQLDVEAALEYLNMKYPNREIYAGGASIGANFVLKFMSEDQSIKKGFGLSAGLDYYGARAIDYVKELSGDQSILLVGAKDDVRGSGLDRGTQAEQLYDLATSQKEKIIYETGDHGTDMFAAHPDLPQKIVHFLTA